ncbi:MAG: zinc ribbon domain-containing protein [Candidatus Methanoplasma sp.]|jgi:ribosomal protein L40E|nr:zinc ribbon domain-containing protein [Candidatus Methanoplasma sp.]
MDEASALRRPLKLTPKQIAVTLAALIISLALTLSGFGASFCLGMLIIAVILYMVPRMAGATDVRLLAGLGVVFFVSSVLLGAFVMAPGFIDGISGTPSANDHFEDIEYTFENEGLSVSVTVIDADLSGKDVFYYYGKVSGIGFGTVNAALDESIALPLDSGATYKGFVPLDPSTLYAGHIGLSEGGKETDAISYNSVLVGAFDGDITGPALYGCAVSAVYILLFFFMILVLSGLMKSRLEKARTKLEQEGRLYPQGYGRCAQCGGVVLPGEVKCRKCGAYIDRPDEMRPSKKDFFECSECGAEVPPEAESCPRCGAAFDAEESEVTHADGSVEVTTATFECSECGAEVPEAAEFCPKCGSAFEE